MNPLIHLPVCVFNNTISFLIKFLKLQMILICKINDLLFKITFLFKLLELQAIFLILLIWKAMNPKGKFFAGINYVKFYYFDIPF